VAVLGSLKTNAVVTLITPQPLGVKKQISVYYPRQARRCDPAAVGWWLQLGTR